MNWNPTIEIPILRLMVIVLAVNILGDVFLAIVGVIFQ